MAPKSMSQRYRDRPHTVEGGLTLAELVIVLGIIACLVGFLIPAIVTVRAAATAINCKSQLHIIGSSLAAYAASNRGIVGPMPDPLYQSVVHWPQMLYGIPNPKVVVCGTADSAEAISYPLNMMMQFPLRQKRVSFDQIVVAGECVPSHEYYYLPLAYEDFHQTLYSHARHGKFGSNYLWADFHVSNDPPVYHDGMINDWGPL